MCHDCYNKQVLLRLYSGMIFAHLSTHSELTMNFQVYLLHSIWVGKHRGWSLMDEVQTTEPHLPTLGVLCIPETSSDVLAHWDLGSK